MPQPLFTLGKDPVPIVLEAGWAPGPVWTGAEILALTGIRSPDRPARSQSLYRLHYPARTKKLKNIYITCLSFGISGNSMSSITPLSIHLSSNRDSGISWLKRTVASFWKSVTLSSNSFTPSPSFIVQGKLSICSKNNVSSSTVNLYFASTDWRVL